MGFSPLAADLDKDKKVNYGVAPMPTKDGGDAADLRRDRLPHGVQEAGQPGGGQGVLRPLLPAGPGQHVHQGRGLPAGHQDAACRPSRPTPSLKVYLDTLPNVHLTPTDDPTWDKVKLAVQQNLGRGGIDGDPKAVLDDLQKTRRERRLSVADAPRGAGAAPDPRARPPRRRRRPPAGPGRRARRRRRRRTAGVAAAVARARALLLIAGVVVYPAVELVRASFGRYSITGLRLGSAGMANYVNVLDHPDLRHRAGQHRRLGRGGRRR